MSNQADLLARLKLDRDDRPAPTNGGGGGRLLWFVAGLLVLGLLLLAWLWWRPQALLEVRVAPARSAASAPAASASVLDASGYVVARRQATVSSKVTGKVTEVLIEEGQTVAEGEVLARIDDRNAQAQLALAEAQMQAARTQLTEVRVQLADAERTVTRNRELAGKGLVSQAALDSAEASRDSLKARLASAVQQVTVASRSVEVQAQQLDDTVVRAPFAGVVTVKNAQPGEMISPLSAGGDGTRTGIGTVVDMDSLEIEVDVNENFINRVRPGQRVTARLNAYPDLDLPAEVIAVIPTADRSKATVKVRIGLTTRDPRVLPEMGVRVAFLPDAAAADDDDDAAPARGVRVPASAVVEGAAVWVLRDERVERRAVADVEVLGSDARVGTGLRPGERVVVEPPADLVEGRVVRVVS